MERTVLKNTGVFCHLTEYLFELCFFFFFEEDVDCVPSPVSREHWGRIRDENGRVPDSVVQNGVFDEARNRHVEK